MSEPGGPGPRCPELGSYTLTRGAQNPFDHVILHTYFTDETLQRCVRTVKDAAGRDQWLAPSATGSADQCAAAVRGQFALGADAVTMHGASPAELRPIVDAYASL